MVSSKLNNMNFHGSVLQVHKISDFSTRTNFFEPSTVPLKSKKKEKIYDEKLKEILRAGNFLKFFLLITIFCSKKKKISNFYIVKY